ncbi:MAG: hypothetical protein IJ300_12210 [Clostridia bacterium]|nr:hypothetical protein [Clostridia bacterium]
MYELDFFGDVDDLQLGIAAASRHLKFKTGIEGIKIQAKKQSSLTVKIKDDAYLIGYSEKAEFLRGPSLLVSAVKRGESDICINETRSIKTCGVMIDMSRNAVMRVEAYLGGKIARIEELEAERLFYNTTDGGAVNPKQPLPRQNDDKKIITVSV